MILVTGGTGTTGRELVRLLQQAGKDFRVLSRDSARAATLLGEAIDVVQGDMNQPETLKPAFAGVDSLFLLTTPDPHQVEQEGHALEQAEAAGIQRIVKLSVLGASEDSPVAFGRWHACTEKQLLESDLQTTILRPHYFMQNTLQFAAEIASNGTFHLPMRQGKISMVDVRDIAAVAFETLTSTGHEGRTYDLTGPASLGFSDVAQVLAEELGVPVQYVDVPPSDAEKALLAAGLPSGLADALITLFGIYAAGHASECTQAVRDIIGREPHGYQEFVRDHLAAFRVE